MYYCGLLVCAVVNFILYQKIFFAVLLTDVRHTGREKMRSKKH